MSVRLPTQPIVLHALYPTAQARHRLITGEPWASWDSTVPARWYFVDLPFEHATGTHAGLEIVASLPGGVDARRSVEERLRDWMASGLVAQCREVTQPLVLQSALYPAGAVPACYADALAVGSARACRILAGVGPTAATRLAVALVETEFAAMYAAFFPAGRRRRAALLLHAAWLETIALQGGPPTSGGGDAAPASLAVAPSAAARIYAPLRRRLLSHAARLVRRHGVDPRDAATARAGVYAALVARLAHIQALRLASVGWDDGLRREARLARSLASVLPTETR